MNQIKEMADYLISWLQEQMLNAHSDGLVICINGDVDSAVAAALAKRASPNKCLGLIMPYDIHRSDINEAVQLANQIGILHHIVPLESCHTAYMRILRQYPESFFKADRLKLEQIKINWRMQLMTAFFMAGMLNYSVVGTFNKCENYVGYATKVGDNTISLQVLGDLFKSEIHDLAQYLGVPNSIIRSSSSSGAWKDTTGEEEMGFSYAAVETFLQTGSGDDNVVARIQDMHRRSNHVLPLMPLINRVG